MTTKERLAGSMILITETDYVGDIIPPWQSVRCGMH